jgi:hypothetical protein
MKPTSTTHFFDSTCARRSVAQILTLWALFLLPMTLPGQSSFQVRFDTLPVADMPRLHSFAYARHKGKWLLLGGRQDGLHPKFGGFNTASANRQIWVVNPETAQVWSRSITALPDTLQEQLRSANMEFYHHDASLLFAGGYGYSDLAQNHITYPYLTVIDVPGLVQSVVEGGPLLPHFHQMRDTFFAVTGGQMQALADTFYLVGGHLFNGIYSANSDNPTQRYTAAIRKFTLGNLAGTPQVTHRSEQIDELNLHRRDYNLSPHIFENGDHGLMAFSGVFQPGLALKPFLNIVAIHSGGHHSVNGFSQFLTNYHCARIPVYSASENQMHTLFFGGMSEYWLSDTDSLLRDSRLPFVKTASRVTRLPDGSYEEVAFDAELPYYTGTGAEFILADNAPLVTSEIVNYDALPNGSHLLGYIVGGIVTPGSQRNPFTSNAAAVTSASPQVLRVWLEKGTVSSAKDQALEGRYALQMKVFPNPAEDALQLSARLPRAGRLLGTLQNALGRIVLSRDWGLCSEGLQQFELSAAGLPAGLYWLTLRLDGVFTETITIAKK